MATRRNEPLARERQTGTADPERKIAKSARPAPGRRPGKAGEADEIPETAASAPDPADEYDESADAGITDLPPAFERREQRELPPRGTRKGSYHA
jgi:hypothetical protein